MNLKLVTLFLFTLNPVFGQQKKSENPLFDKSLNKDSIKAEFETLYNLTNTIHPGQFMFCTKREFDKTYRRLQKSIKTDLSVVEYYRRTATLMAKIKDGHTAADPSHITSLLQKRLVFPFRIRKIKDNYYLANAAPENSDFIGLRILKINGKSIQTVVSELRKYIHLEGENETGLNIKFRNFPFYYFVYNARETFEIEYIDSNNQKQKETFNGIPFNEYSAIIAEFKAPMNMEFLSNDVALLKFHSFANGYNPEERAAAEKELDQFFNQLDSLKTHDLIIDLRGNSGGAAEIANYLFSYLHSKPYHYFDYAGAKYTNTDSWKHYAQYPENNGNIDTNETKLIHGLHCYTNTDSTDYWWFEEQQNKANYFRGNVSVLIDGACFSTTGHFLALLKEHNIGQIYGEYSQGSNYSNSGGQAFTLPYSKSVIWIPTFQFKMKTPNFFYDPKGIKPDIEIPIEPMDLKTHFDRVMDFVVKKMK